MFGKIFLQSAIVLLALFNGREQIHINNDTQQLLLPVTDLHILVDTVGNLSFKDVQNRQQDFQINAQFLPKDYCSTCTYWVKVPIWVEEDLKKQWVIEFYDQTIDIITAYIPDGKGGYDTYYAGDRLDFFEKEFAHKNFEWLINMNPGRKDFYFKVRSHNYADIRVNIRTLNRFIGYALSEYFLYGIFYGMIFIISIYNVLMFLAIKERKYLFYTFYILSVGVYAMCVDGIAYQYLWPTWPEWNQIAYGAALFSLIFWSLIFSKRFLNTRVRAPFLNKVLIWTIIARSAFFLFALVFNQDLFQLRNIEIIPLSLVFYSSIAVWMRGYKPARFFALAYGILFSGFLIKALLYLSIIPHSNFSYYSLHICFLLEMLFLTFALSDRVRIMKANRDRALKRIILQHQENAELKDKVNRELEEKIRQRTVELEHKNLQLSESNNKLIEQSKEINAINSQLDLDNWKLKSNIKEILQDRLINKDLSLEQFQKIFPDKITCFRFLDRLKWGEGYSCSKCDNTKYLKGQYKFSRRCTKCGYDESITSNTIFHGIKFPIEKAFYILYVTNNRKSNYTLDELSEMLNMRRNTIWSFKKKIEDLYKKNSTSTPDVLIHNLFSAHLN